MEACESQWALKTKEMSRELAGERDGRLRDRWGGWGGVGFLVGDCFRVRIIEFL